MRNCIAMLFTLAACTTPPAEPEGSVDVGQNNVTPEQPGAADTAEPLDGAVEPEDASGSPPKGVPVGNQCPEVRFVKTGGTEAGDIATFDASGTTDADGDRLTFSWRLLARPAGSASAVSNATFAVSQVFLDLAGSYVLELVVSDGRCELPPELIAVVIQP